MFQDFVIKEIYSRLYQKKTCWPFDINLGSLLERTCLHESIHKMEFYITGMFMQDFLQFIEEVERGTSSDRSRQRALHCMEVAEKIHSFMGL